MPSKSSHALDGKIITIERGIAIYKTHASPYWNAQIRNTNTQKYLVRSTKEKSSIKARTAALDLATDLLITRSAVPAEFTFKYYATRFLEKGRAQAARGERNENYIRSAQIFLNNEEWGLMKTFATQDVREIKTRQYQQFIDSSPETP